MNVLAEGMEEREEGGNSKKPQEYYIGKLDDPTDMALS